MSKRFRNWVSDSWITGESTSDFDQTIAWSSSTREVERLPRCIFVQILELIGPKDAARLAAVCKSWKQMIFDDTLWLYFLNNQEDGVSILFAETKLRFFPLRPYPRQILSFMHIYGERAQATGALIIDAGVGYCKIGWSKDGSPSLRLGTAEFGDIKSSLTSRVHHFCETIYHRMHVKPSMLPVILTTPIGLNPGAEKASCQQLRDAVFSALIRMRVPSICTVSQATLALFASRRISGILVNIGYHETQVFPIVCGYTRHKVVSVKIGGSHLTSYLKRRLRARNLHISSTNTVRLLKENLCYVALDYDAELKKDTEASYEVGSDGWYTLNKERFQTGEILFQPQIARRNVMGLQHVVAHCIERQVKGRTVHNWCKTIVLAGGTANLPGLTERLNKELLVLLPSNISHGIRVIPSPYGADAAWHGAKMVGNLSSFRNSWCF